MSVPHTGFSVPFDFPVQFTRNAWAPDNRAVVDAIRRLEPGRRHRLLVVVDDGLASAQESIVSRIESYTRAHQTSLELACPPVLAAGGEAVKNDLRHPFDLLQRINALGIDRQSVVVAVGGGAVLDMASFAAAVAHRGVRVVRIPTTVLAQADSGIAVKNSMNLFGKKNFIGTFVPPFAVVADTDALATLSFRDRIAGLSEAVKVALIKCPSFYHYIEGHVCELVTGQPEVLAAVVQRSAELHLQHICTSGDPFELGSARPLDFGHWAAHKLESLTDHRIRHGEAVAIGMALDLLYCADRGFLPATTADSVLRLLEALGFCLWDDAMAERTVNGSCALTAGLREFREHLGGELHVTLLRGIGNAFETTEMDEAAIERAILTLAARERGHRTRVPLLAATAS